MWQVELFNGRGWVPVRASQREAHAEALKELRRVRALRIGRNRLRVSYLPLPWC